MVLDNMLRTAGCSTPRTTTTARSRDLNAALVADDRLDVVLLPVRDGVSLARKR